MSDQNITINVGVKDDAGAKMKSIGESIKSSFDKISAAATVALAAVGGFALKAASDFANTGEHIANLSEQTGISALSLSGMKVAADEMGLSLETVTMGMKHLQVNLAAMGDNSKKANEALKPLGLTFNDIKNLKPEEQLFKMGDAIARIKDPTERTSEAVKLFGRSGAELLPFFQQGNATLDDFVKHAKDMGLAFDDISANKAAALDHAFDSIKSSIAGATQQIASALAPAITKLVDSITPWIQKLSEWISKNPELTAQIIGWTMAILAVIAVIGPLITIVGTLGTALAFLAANPVVLIIAAFVALAFALHELYVRNQAFRDAVNQVWTWMGPFIQATGKLISEHIKSFITIVQTIWQGWNILVNFLQTNWEKISSVITTSITTISGIISGGMSTISGFWSSIWNGMYAVVSAIISQIEAEISRMMSLISGAVSFAKGALAQGSSAAKNVSSGGIGGIAGSLFRATGGPVSAGVAYRVGEQGPEEFVPSSNGVIIPNNQMGGGGIQIVITGNTLLDRNAATKIGDLIIENLRLQRRLA